MILPTPLAVGLNAWCSIDAAHADAANPVQQYLSTYTVLTPPGYTKNYINIVAPLETEVTVDNKLLNLPFEPVGDGEWGVIQLPVQEGVHEVEASSKVGLTAYGYDCDVSYAYPGGMRLKVLDDDGGTP